MNLCINFEIFVHLFESMAAGCWATAISCHCRRDIKLIGKNFRWRSLRSRQLLLFIFFCVRRREAAVHNSSKRIRMCPLQLYCLVKFFAGARCARANITYLYKYPQNYDSVHFQDSTNFFFRRYWSTRGGYVPRILRFWLELMWRNLKASTT